MTTHLFVNRFIEDLALIGGAKQHVRANSVAPCNAREPWVPPPTGFSKFNVDAAIATHNGRGSVAVVCRDERGMYLGSSTMVYAITDPPTLETLACREALSLALDLDEHPLLIASDCQSVIKDIVERTGGANAAIVKEITARREEFGACRFRFESRKSNFEAHALARFAISLKIGRHVWFGSPHDSDSGSHQGPGGPRGSLWFCPGPCAATTCFQGRLGAADARHISPPRGLRPTPCPPRPQTPVATRSPPLPSPLLSPPRAGHDRGTHGDDDDHDHHDEDGAAPPRVLRARAGAGGGRRPGGAVERGGGGAGEGGRQVERRAAAPEAVRGAAGLPARQRVHPRRLPLRVVRPRRAPQRLRLAQRDAQRLDPSGGLLPVPGPRRRRPDGVAAGRSSRGAGARDDGDDVGQRVVVGGQQQFEHGDPERAGVGHRRRGARGGALAADGVRVRGHDVPVGERGGAPAGEPLAPLQPALLAARLRRHRRHDRRLLLPAGLLHLPRQPRGAIHLPLRHHAARRARRGRAPGARPLVAAAPAPPRGPLRVHGALGGRAGAARALAQLGPPGVLPGAVARAGHGARVRHGRRVLRRARAGAVAPGHVRLRGAQPPDLPRAGARRRRHALRRHRHPHRLARRPGRRGVGALVTSRVVGCDMIFMYA